MNDQKDPTFTVMGKTITLISDECYFGRNTVADIEGTIHYMGNEYPTLSTAIFAWQEVNDRMLTGEEIRQVMIDNGLIQSGEYNDSNDPNQNSSETTSSYPSNQASSEPTQTSASDDSSTNCSKETSQEDNSEPCEEITDADIIEETICPKTNSN